ncbi:MAG: hypothetical protein FWE17_01050 [Alphaproteobacteria bacterium]|nr:hypothetical protein [Alphaproteobacteria bacterium]MCL2758202.1 hypothetical protein [Alphaproteobacteria bacterium]
MKFEGRNYFNKNALYELDRRGYTVHDMYLAETRTVYQTHKDWMGHPEICYQVRKMNRFDRNQSFIGTRFIKTEKVISILIGRTHLHEVMYFAFCGNQYACSSKSIDVAVQKLCSVLGAARKPSNQKPTTNGTNKLDGNIYTLWFNGERVKAKVY